MAIVPQAALSSGPPPFELQVRHSTDQTPRGMRGQTTINTACCPRTSIHYGECLPSLRDLPINRSRLRS